MAQKTDPVFTDFTCSLQRRELTDNTHAHSNLHQLLPLSRAALFAIFSLRICSAAYPTGLSELFIMFPSLMTCTKQSTVSYTSLPSPAQNTRAANEGLTRLTSPDLTKARVGGAAIGWIRSDKWRSCANEMWWMEGGKGQNESRGRVNERGRDYKRERKG